MIYPTFWKSNVVVSNLKYLFFAFLTNVISFILLLQNYYYAKGLGGSDISRDAKEAMTREGSNTKKQ